LFVELVWLFTCLSMCFVRDRQSIFFQRNSRFFRTNFACTLISCCSIVNDLCARFSADSLNSIPHLGSFVNRFPKTFFKFFSPSASRLAEYSLFTACFSAA